MIGPMDQPPISRYPIPDLEDLPSDLAEINREVEQRTGFLPNVFMALAHRPDELRAFLSYLEAVMERESGLSKTDKEMIVVATSAENNCQYCVIAHGAVLRIRAKNPLVADQVAINFRKADITERQRAMLEFAVKVVHHSDLVNDADFATLYGHGFDDEDIWDIAAITALFGMSNRMANFTSMRPNDEFYSMAR